jgi:hypothetical protein
MAGQQSVTPAHLLKVGSQWAQALQRRKLKQVPLICLETIEQTIFTEMSQLHPLNLSQRIRM